MGKLWDSLQKRISEAVKPHGKLSEFVKTTGFSRSAVENWRDGLAIPGIDKLEKICEALNIPPAALLDPGAPPIPARIADLIPLLAKADDDVLNIIRDLLVGHAMRIEAKATARNATQPQEKKPSKS